MLRQSRGCCAQLPLNCRGVAKGADADEQVARVCEKLEESRVSFYLLEPTCFAIWRIHYFEYSEQWIGIHCPANNVKLTEKWQQYDTLSANHYRTDLLRMDLPALPVVAILRQEQRGLLSIARLDLKTLYCPSKNHAYLPPQTSAYKMRGMTVFDHLLFLMAPLITYLVSKIQIFAPQSPYVVVHDARPAPADLLISTRYLEIYVPHNLTVALFITLSILSLLHLTYSVHASRQPLLPVKLPWKTELEVYRNLRDKGTLSRSSKTHDGVLDVIRDKRPQHSLYRSLFTRSSTCESDISQQDVELKELAMPQAAHVRDSTPLRFQCGTYERRHEVREDDDDWRTVYCEEWEDGSQGEDAAGVESWSPT